jgi:hypothetical protein
MAEPVYLSWNVVNWITVLLMAAIGFAIVGFAASMLRQYGVNIPSLDGGGAAGAN